jgi:oxygen-independent coproporphyrinogen-3 oxidase
VGEQPGSSEQAAAARPAAQRDALSLYLHIPFCRHRCGYCDFNTYAGLAELQAPYVQALVREIEQVAAAAPAPLAVATVFFGGGTPSLLALAQLGDVLAALRRSFALAPDCEITLEANPGTVDARYLEGLVALGVNRISFGVQSAQPDELALLERQHSFAEAAEAVAQARRAGFSALGGINIDLIFGLPGQSLASWQATLARGLALEPEHISLYCLTLEAGTRLYGQVLRGEVARPDDDLAADQYLYTEERLAAAGFEHYEISNWARPSRACRHNLVYWRNQAYLGLGAGAHGSYGSWRYSNVLRPRRYIARLSAAPATETQAAEADTTAARAADGRFPFSPALAQREAVTPAGAMDETMMLGLRLLDEGVGYAAFAARHGADLRAVYAAELEEGKRLGLLERGPERVRLTPQGHLLGNKAFALFLRGDGSG